MRTSTILTSVGLLLSMLTAYAHASDDGMVVCTYITGGQDRAGKYNYRIKDMPGEYCTHIWYYGMLVDSNTGAIKAIRNDYKQLTAFKQRFPQLSYVNSIVFDQDTCRSLQRESFRKDFTRELVKFMHRNPFDGVAISFLELEQIAAANDPIDLPLILKDIREAFQQAGKPWKIYVKPDTELHLMEKYVDKKAVCDAADFVTIDTANLRDTKNAYVDVPSPLRKRPHDIGNNTKYNVEDITQSFLDAGCPPQKLFLGVGLMGMLYKLSSSSETTVGSPSVGRLPWQSLFRNDGSQAYFEFCRRIDEDEWTSGWDPIGAAPYIYSQKKWIGYENERSLEERVRFLKEKRLAGIQVLSIDMDDYIGQCGKRHALLSTIHKHMRQ